MKSMILRLNFYTSPKISSGGSILPGRRDREHTYSTAQSVVMMMIIVTMNLPN
jgi:hypothetical protein